jgi:hypothetical protein
MDLLPTLTDLQLILMALLLKNMVLPVKTTALPK